MRVPKRATSPKASNQPRGTSSQPLIANVPASLPARRTRDARLVAPRSSDRLQFGIAGQQHGREHVEEGEDAEEGDHHALVDRAPHPRRAARGGHPLVAADDGDDPAEQGAHQDRAPDVGDQRVGEEGGEEPAQRLAVDQRGDDARGEAEDDREDVEQAGDHHQRQEAGHDQVLDRVDAEHLQGVDPIKNLVVPRFLALMVITGLFDIYALLFGISGGIAASVLYDSPLGGFFATLYSNASVTDLWASVVKCTLFGAIITIVCSYKAVSYTHL